MSDPRIAPLRDAKRRYQQERVDGIEAITGRLQSDGNYGNQRDAAWPDKIWVTRTDNREERLVWKNGRVDDSRAGVSVVIKFSDADGWYVDKGANEKLAISHRGVADDMLSPRRTGDLVSEVYPGRNLKPARVKGWVANSLKVNAYAFWYLDANGNRKRWTPPEVNDDGEVVGTDTCLDLSAYVPTSNRKAWVVVDFDPSVPELVATSAALRALSEPGTPPFSDIEAVPLADGHLPLWAFLLMTGDTTEADVPVETEQEDLRFWLLGGSGAGAASALGEPLLDDDGAFLLDDDGAILYADAS